MKKGLKQIVSILLCCVMLLTNVQITYAVDSETNTTDNNNFVENSTEKSSENSVDVVSGSAISADVESNDTNIVNETPKAILYNDGTLVLYTTSDVDKTDYSCIFDDISKIHSSTYSKYIGKVIIKDKISLLNYSNFFAGCNNLREIENIENLDISKATNLSNMFADCFHLESLDLSSFDTSNVTNFANMFDDCSNLRTLNLSSFDTSNATDLSGMFSGCSSLTTLNLSNFDTSHVIYMFAMFNHCESLCSLDLSSFDTSNVTNIRVMFNYCKNLDSLDLSNFDITNVTDLSDMFYGCAKLKEIKGLENWNTVKSVYYNSMFYNCSSLVKLNLSTFFANSNPVSYNNMLDGTDIKTLTLNPSRISENLLKSLPDVTYKVNGTCVKNTDLYDEIKNETDNVDILGPINVTFIDTKTKKHLDEGVYYDTIFSDITKDLEDYFNHSDDFLGWYTTLLNNTKPLDSNDLVYTNTIYYGLYSDDTYTITYKYDGKEKKQVVAYDTTTRLFENIFDKDGSVLIGWTDGTNDYKLGQKVKNLGNVVLEPKWGSLRYYCKLTFDYNDGTNRTRIEYVYSNTKYKNTVEYVDRDGYTFMGWYDSTGRMLDKNYTVGEDTVFYAKYSKGLSLTFKDDYNSLNNCSYTVKENSSVSSFAPKFKQSKAGKVFLGWSLDKQHIIDEYYRITEDTILYAIYTYKPVLGNETFDNETVARANFDGQDSNLYELTKSNFPVFQSSTLSLDGFYNNGIKLQVGSIIDLDVDNVIEVRTSLKQDVTLTLYQSGKGNLDNKLEVKCFKGEKIYLDNFIKEDEWVNNTQKFKYWTDEFNTVYHSSDKITMDSDRTLYANFESVELYTVTFIIPSKFKGSMKYFSYNNVIDNSDDTFSVVYTYVKDELLTSMPTIDNSYGVKNITYRDETGADIVLGSKVTEDKVYTFTLLDDISKTTTIKCSDSGLDLEWNAYWETPYASIKYFDNNIEGFFISDNRNTNVMIKKSKNIYYLPLTLYANFNGSALEKNSIKFKIPKRLTGGYDATFKDITQSENSSYSFAYKYDENGNVIIYNSKTLQDGTTGFVLNVLYQIESSKNYSGTANISLNLFDNEVSNIDLNYAVYKMHDENRGYNEARCFDGVDYFGSSYTYGNNYFSVEWSNWRNIPTDWLHNKIYCNGTYNKKSNSILVNYPDYMLTDTENYPDDYILYYDVLNIENNYYYISKNNKVDSDTKSGRGVSLGYIRKNIKKIGSPSHTNSIHGVAKNNAHKHSIYVSGSSNQNDFYYTDKDYEVSVEEKFVDYADEDEFTFNENANTYTAKSRNLSIESERPQYTGKKSKVELTDNDYCIDSINIRPEFYGIHFDDSFSEKIYTEPIDIYYFKVYLRYANTDKFVFYKNISKYYLDNLEYPYKIYLPDNVVDYKIEYSSKYYKSVVDVTSTYNIHKNQNLLSLVAYDLGHKTGSDFVFTGKAKCVETDTDLNVYEEETIDSISLPYKEIILSQSIDVDLDTSKTDDNVVSTPITVTCKNTATADGYMPNITNAEFGILLPNNLYLDNVVLYGCEYYDYYGISSSEYTITSKKYVYNSVSYNLYVIKLNKNSDNYKRFELEANVKGLKLLTRNFSDTIYCYYATNLNATRLTNSATDYGSSSVIGDLYKNRDKNMTYCFNTKNISFSNSSYTEWNFNSIALDTNGNIVNDKNKLSNKDNYDLYVVYNSKVDTNVKDMVFYTVLSDSNGWKGNFNSISINKSMLKGINGYCNPVIYYSVKENISDSDCDISDSTIWTTELPENKSSITAVAVDCRKTSTNKDYIFPKNTTLYYNLNLSVPSKVSNTVNTTKSYLKSNFTDATENNLSATSLLPMKISYPSIDFTSSPATKSTLFIGDTLDYTVKISNSSNHPIDNVKVKLNIPKEVEVKSIKSGKNALTYTLENDGYYYVTVPEIQEKSNCNLDIHTDVVKSSSGHSRTSQAFIAAFEDLTDLENISSNRLYHYFKTAYTKNKLTINSLDDKTREYIPNVKYRLYGTDDKGNKVDETFVATDGTYTLSNIGTGDYTIDAVDKPENYPETYRDYISVDDKDKEFDCLLQRKAIFNVTVKWLDDDNYRVRPYLHINFKNTQIPYYKGYCSFGDTYSSVSTYKCRLDYYCANNKDKTYDWTLDTTDLQKDIKDKYYMYLDQKGNDITIILSSYTHLSVQKTWLNDTESDRPDSIDFVLYQNGSIYETKSTTKDANWSCSFSAPTYNSLGQLYDYTIKEVALQNYKVNYVDTYKSLHIRFDLESETNYDYIYLYYKLDGKYYYKQYTGTTRQIYDCYIPSNEFWLMWRTDSSGNDYYGFKLLKVEPSKHLADSFSGNYFDRLPSDIITDFTLNEIDTIESKHNPYDNNVSNKIWHYKDDEHSISDVSIIQNTKVDNMKSLSIKKVDEEGNYVIGAKLQLLKSDGSIYKEWVTTESSEIVQAIDSGIYTLHEVSAPIGYSIAEDKKIEIKDDDTLKEVKMIDKKALKATHKLSVKNKVHGNASNQSDVFNYILTLTGYTNENIEYEKNGVTSTALLSDGKLEFSMTGTDSVTFTLPKDAIYSINVVDTKGYLTNITKANGILSEDREVEFDFSKNKVMKKVTVVDKYDDTDHVREEKEYEVGDTYTYQALNKDGYTVDKEEQTGIVQDDVTIYFIYTKINNNQPTTPTEPSTPTQPTQPTQPTPPSEPTQPSEPTPPSEPSTEPNEPDTEPTKPQKVEKVKIKVYDKYDGKKHLRKEIEVKKSDKEIVLNALNKVGYTANKKTITVKSNKNQDVVFEYTKNKPKPDTKNEPKPETPVQEDIKSPKTYDNRGMYGVILIVLLIGMGITFVLGKKKEE